MNDTTTNQNETGTTEADYSFAPTLQDVEKKFFPPEQVEQGSEYVNSVMQIAERENVEPVFNFDPEQEFPEGYGLAVIPLQQRVPERGNQTYGVAVAAIPSLDKIQENEAGQAWMGKVVTDALLRQVTLAAKPKEEGEVTSLPLKIEDFVTSARTSGLAAFNAVASDYVKALKQKGLKFMSKVLLRQVLASSQFAEQQFPRLSQDNWQLVLDSMISHVKQKGMEPGILNHWKQTRDQVEIDTGDIDLSDIEDIVED